MGRHSDVCQVIHLLFSLQIETPRVFHSGIDPRIRAVFWRFSSGWSDRLRALRRVMARVHPPRHNTNAAQWSEGLLALPCLCSGRFAAGTAYRWTSSSASAVGMHSIKKGYYHDFSQFFLVFFLVFSFLQKWEKGGAGREGGVKTM